jgi:small subunit ribosomal protein S7
VLRPVKVHNTMRGSKKAKQRKHTPDAVYNNVLITRLINRIMYDGKKSVAQKQVYDAFEIIKKKHEDPAVVFQEALRNITPQMEVRSRRIGGAAYQVPVPVRGNRKTALSLRWLIFEARKRSSSEYHTFSEKLAAEIMEAYNREGGAVKRKETSHKMAESNRAFSHFRW